jgi:hypothetical protein
VDGRVVSSDVVRGDIRSQTVHNSHQICIRVVPPEEGQVMPETCRDPEP